ncbi:MAG: Gfo/Idh/MocA family oxidoreductase [Verrucomicrobia bacterium]|nr:Gfo/Idh/MocA family oxidoreductase [Verrucomicrobiota bacterium]
MKLRAPKLEERNRHDQKVRIGFVGVGSMGQCAHLRNYATLNSCEVVALAEIKPELGRRVADRYGVPAVYQDYEDMLAKESLDGIVASQPFTRHGVLVPELAKAGVPLFTEKPLAASIAVGEAILTALATHGTRHMVGYHKRSDPATEYAKAAIDGFVQSGELGAMRYVRALMPAGDWIASGFSTMISTDEPNPKLAMDPPPADMDDATRGAYQSFVNYYIHQVNLLRHLLGEPYTCTHADPSGVLFVGRSASGIACTIEMTPYQTSVDWQESVLIAFEHGYINLSLPAPLAHNRPGQVEILKDTKGGKPEVIRPHLPWQHAMHRQAENFVRFVRGESAPCEATEALEDLKVAREYIRLRSGG